MWRKRQALNICVGCLATDCMRSLWKQWVLIEFTLFELGANGSWPVLSGWSVGRNRDRGVILCIVCCCSSSQRKRRWRKLRTRAGIKPWLLQHIKCVRWELTLAVVVHSRPLLWGEVCTHDMVLSDRTGGCSLSPLVSGNSCVPNIFPSEMTSTCLQQRHY